jgi:pyruvate formate lyase activating enzyme
VDYIAMDLKHTWGKYPHITQVPEDLGPYRESVRTLLEGIVDYEFRTTVIGGVHTVHDIEDMARMIDGARNYFLQSFRPGKLLDPNF